MSQNMVRALLPLVGAAVLASASFSSGAVTPVNPLGGGNGGERCLVGSGPNGMCGGPDASSNAYKNSFSMVSIFEKDRNLAAGSIVRVDDSLDRIWTNSVNSGGQVRVLAGYSGDRSQLGYDAGSGFTFLTGPLANNTVLVHNPAAHSGDNHSSDYVAAADSWINIALGAGVPFAFVLNDLSMNYMISSDTGFASPSYANGQTNLDYMTTFRVNDDDPNYTHFIIAWEDRNPNLGDTGDYDYNDFVVEVRFANAIPEPEIYAMLGVGLGLMGWKARRKKTQAA